MARSPFPRAVATTENKEVQGSWLADGLRVTVVAARFNYAITEALVDGARDAWSRLGGEPGALSVVWVPGAFELPLVARRLAMQPAARAPHAVVCLGAIIRGETPHFDHVASQSASGILQASLASDRPVIYGVLTCNTTEQAEARAGRKAGNKGADALLAAVETVRVLERIGH